jgi:chaperonin GroES
MRLMGDMIMVKKVDFKKKSSIILTGNTGEVTYTGEIILVGPGLTTDDGVVVSTGLCTGEIIMFSTTAGWNITIKKDEFIVLPARNIICVLDKEDLTE